jgi:hypothetical protein
MHVAAKLITANGELLVNFAHLISVEIRGHAQWMHVAAKLIYGERELLVNFVRLISVQIRGHAQ